MKKRRKEIYKKYRGIGILKDSAYTDNDLFNNRKDLRSLRVMLMTPDIERYFNTIGQARAYVDANFDKIRKEQENMWRVFDETDTNVELQERASDDIPF